MEESAWLLEAPTHDRVGLAAAGSDPDLWVLIPASVSSEAADLMEPFLRSFSQSETLAEE